MSGMGIAGVLTEHDWFTPRGYAWPCCNCGVEFTNGEQDAYAHVADAIAAHLAEVLGGLREDVARADWLRQQELASGRPIEGVTEDFAWRMTPRHVRDAYCCVADAVLAVVVEALTGHPARSGGAVGDDRGEVAESPADDLGGPQIGYMLGEREARP